MSVKRSKQILGLFSILIMLHHLGQKTSAFWVPDSVRQHGLEPFVPIGYLVVSFFFFCSGYGLIKSARSKKDYFEGFLVKRLNRILLVFVLTQIIWGAMRISKHVTALPLNPYSWFVYTIIILYFGFYFIYKKENRYSHILMAAWILLYSIICYVLVLGNWWFNASPVFLLGIIIADKEGKKTGEEADKELDKMPGIKSIIILGVLFIICFAVTELGDKIYHAIGMSSYSLYNLIKVLLQIVAASAFSMLIYYLAQKMGESKGGKAGKEFSFFGSFTLEFYLIHGLFVQIFGHHFIDDTTRPVFYIKNVFLYVIVVFVLSTASAFALRKLTDFIISFHSSSKAFQKFTTDMARIAFILLIIAVAATVISTIYRASSSKKAFAEAEKYKDENIKMINVNGTDVAVYDAGEGEYTVVLLSSDVVPCPTVHAKPFADEMSKDYRVVMFDYPGTGFSGDSSDERTSDFYADLTRGVLDELGIKDNIILVSHLLSGAYAYKFIEKYPEGVAGMVGVDSVVPHIAPHFLDQAHGSEDEFRWYAKRYAGITRVKQTVLAKTGLMGAQLPMYEFIYGSKEMQELIPVMKEMYIKDYNRGAHLEENKNAYDNLLTVKDYKVPEDLPTAFLLTDYMKDMNAYSINWKKAYELMITNEDIQSVTVINGDPYVIYYNPEIIKQKTDELTAAGKFD